MRKRLAVTLSSFQVKNYSDSTFASCWAPLLCLSCFHLQLPPLRAGVQYKPQSHHLRSEAPPTHLHTGKSSTRPQTSLELRLLICIQWEESSSHWSDHRPDLSSSSAHSFAYRGRLQLPLNATHRPNLFFRLSEPLDSDLLLFIARLQRYGLTPVLKTLFEDEQIVEFAIISQAWK